MAKIDTHMQRLVNKLKEIEENIVIRNFAQVLFKIGDTDRLPKNKIMRAEVIKYKICAQQMADTMPGPIPEEKNCETS